MRSACLSIAYLRNICISLVTEVTQEHIDIMLRFIHQVAARSQSNIPAMGIRQSPKNGFSPPQSTSANTGPKVSPAQGFVSIGLAGSRVCNTVQSQSHFPKREPWPGTKTDGF